MKKLLTLLCFVQIFSLLLSPLCHAAEQETGAPFAGAYLVCVDPADKVYAEGELPKLALRPLRDGPYTPDELGQLARNYYFTNTGYYVPHADTDVNQNGSVTIHLYEVVNTDGVSHTATSAWYTVDAWGNGTDDVFGNAVSLVPTEK